MIVDKCACIILRRYLRLVEVIISADTSAALLFKGASVSATVSSSELAAQPLSTPHRCLRVTVLKLSDLTAFATSRFFCERSHSFPLVLCSFCERSHSFRLVSWLYFSPFCRCPRSRLVVDTLSSILLLRSHSFFAFHFTGGRRSLCRERL